MKVILQQDIKGKGKRGQMIEVPEGYGRNFLLPKKMAVEATADNMNTMRMNDKAAAERLAKERAEAVEISGKLRGLTVKVACKGGGNGRLFGSVTSQEVADALKEQTGIVLDRRKIMLSDTIKNVGTYTAKCRLGFEIVSDLKLEVVEL